MPILRQLFSSILTTWPKPEVIWSDVVLKTKVVVLKCIEDRNWSLRLGLAVDRSLLINVTFLYISPMYSAMQRDWGIWRRRMSVCPSVRPSQERTIWRQILIWSRGLYHPVQHGLKFFKLTFKPYVLGEPSLRGLQTKLEWVKTAKNGDFSPLSHWIAETTENRLIVIMED